jgi:hypothetical protein
MGTMNGLKKSIEIIKSNIQEKSLTSVGKDLLNQAEVKK